MSDFIKKYDLINRILAICIAIILWVIVMDIKNPIVSAKHSDILVDFTSLDLIEDNYDLVIVSDAYPKVDVTIKGSRDEVIQISQSNIDITADLSSIKEPGEYQVEYNVKLPFSDISVTNKYPEKLNVIIDVMEIKQIPVIVELEGEPASSYSFDQIDVQSTITVSGPHNELSKVVDAYVTVDVTDANTDVSGVYSVTLRDEYGIDITSENIIQSDKELVVSLPVLQTISVPLKVELIYGEIVNSKRIEGYEIETPYVSIIGQPTYVNAIYSIDLGEINIDDTQYGKAEFVFALPSFNNVSYTSNMPSSVIVNILFTDYTSENFLVSNYIFDEDVFEDLIIVDSITSVLVSGSRADLDMIDSGDISLTLDLERELIEYTDEDGVIYEDYAPMEPGFYEVEAVVSINSWLSFDIENSYTVTIQVIEPEVTEEE